MKNNDHKNRRLFPSIVDPAYYILVLLRLHLMEINNKYINNDSIMVDFGCGCKPYQPIFAPKLARYIGVDLACNPDADIFMDSNSRIPLEENHADIVLSTQVLEHVANPCGYLRECHRILKPGGLLILSTHGYWAYHPSPEDYWRWTMSGLNKLCEESSFQIIEKYGLMKMVPTLIQLFQNHILYKIHWLLRNIFVFMCQSLIIICEKCYPKKFNIDNSCVLLVVAKKN